MKPFNLEQALAGAKVVTRWGAEVTQLHLFNASHSIFVLCGVINDKLLYFQKDGSYHDKSSQSDYDLFMYSEKKEYWINVYKLDNGTIHTTGISFKTKAEARLNKEYTGYLDTIKIWEEQ